MNNYVNEVNIFCFTIVMLSSVCKKIYKYFLPSSNMIIPGLWLGDIDCALDTTFLKINKIDVIVNCTPDKPFAKDSDEKQLSNITLVRLPVYDSLLERDFILMEQYIALTIPYLIQQFIVNRKNVLIHCYAGKQRSGILVVALLYTLLLHNYIPIQTIGLKKHPSSRHALADKVFAFVLSRRPQVFTFGFRINFIQSFQRYFNLSPH